MKVITIMGSPRKAGHTANVLNVVESELIKLNHSVERINLIDYRINYCKGRSDCIKPPDSYSCEQNDDVNLLFNRMKLADLIIYATPLYFWSYSGLLKNFIDRHYCLVNEKLEQSASKTIISGKKTGLIITCRDFDTSCTNELQTNFKRFASFFLLVLTDILVVPFYKDQAELSQEMQQLAIDYAHKLAGNFTSLDSSEVLKSI